MNDTLKAAGRIGAELGAAKAENEKLRGLLHDAHDTIRNLAEDLDEEEFQATIDQLAEIELALAPQQAEPCGTCEPEGIMATDGSGPFDCPDCGKKAAARNGSESVETRAVTGLKGAAQTTSDTYTAVDMATAAAQGFRDRQAAVEPAPAQDERNPTPDDYLAARSALESCDWSNVPIGTKAILGHVVDLLWLAAQARPVQTEQQPVGAPKCATCNGFDKELSVYEGGIPCRSCKSDPTTAQDEREAFEAWAASCGVACAKTPRALMFANGFRIPVGGYILPETALAWESWQARAARPAQTEQQPVEVMQFQFKHPDTGDAHAVALTRQEVADGMEDTLYEKLGALICDCNRDADHECGDYIYEFELVNAAPIAQTAPQPEQSGLTEALNSLLSWAERQICTHEETHRGGAIWEICDACNAKWADDEGGKPEFKWPAAIEQARAALSVQGATND